MRLSKIAIKNFRSIKSLELPFPRHNLLVLVGANNAGKSNIIKAIDLLCGEQWFGSDKKQDRDHYLRVTKYPIEITLWFDNGLQARWASNEQWASYTDGQGRPIPSGAKRIKEDFPCTYLGADRTFDRHMAFHDWTLLGKIRKAFHQHARPIEAGLREKFAEIVQLFDQIQGFAEFKKDFSQFFREMQADTPARLSIDFQPYTPSNYFKTMQILADDPSRADRLDIEELGEGSRNIVLLALLRSYAKNFKSLGGSSGILALEEPEIYMHPQARRHLFKVLQEIASTGMQVIISTHSASFVDTERFDAIGRVVRIPDDETDGCFHTEVRIVSKPKLVAHCIKTGVPKEKTNLENIGEFYKTTANPMLNEAFFARYLLLVEGDTEELALPVYLRSLDIDCDLLGISIISVRGKSQIPKYWRLFSAFQIPTLVLVDNDKTKEKARSNDTLATCFDFETADMLEGVDVCKRLVSREATDLETVVIVLEQDFETALEKDFESACNQSGQIAQWEQDARQLIKPIGDQNKGQIARFVARKLQQRYPEYVPKFVREIADVLRAAGCAGSNEPLADAVAEAAPFQIPDEDDPF